MFSAYPDGWPGLGLLLLRSAVGSVLVVQGITLYREVQNLGLLILVTVLLTVLLGILILIGLLTRFATAVTVLGTVGFIFSWFPTPRGGLFETRSTPVLALTIAAAIAFIGPGAFSVDARIFGRREVIIGQDPRV